MGLNEVVDALGRAEQLLEDGETGPAQDYSPGSGLTTTLQSSSGKHVPCLERAGSFGKERTIT